ncbi:M24 family metallopeptidase [Chloroflexota bacterium]
MRLKIDSRLQKLRQKLTEKEIDAIFISQPENRCYLSGFNGSAGFLLITEQRAILATDFRYIEQVRTQASDYEVFRITNAMANWFPELIAGFDLKKLGVETEHITFAMYRQLNDILKEQHSPLKLVPAEGLVESLRAVKEPGEIEFITKAAEISDGAFNYIESIIDTGMSEQEIAWEIEKCLHERGSHGIPFDIIVASGPNSALPHAKSSERIINIGEPVVIDMGARFEGYSSDLTRTICLGPPDETFKKVYDIVLGAQLTAIAIVKEGMTGDQADSLARTVIRETNYGEAFGHGLGHGIGLATHESPRLGPGSTELLTSGMVFTIEPGIYLSGWGGVRIEDIIALDNNKAKVISKARKG